MNDRGTAPLYAFWSTNNIYGTKVTRATQGNTEGFKQMTAKLGSNHGGFEIVLREAGDFELAFIPWKSPTGTRRGTKRLLAKGNLRDVEELFPPKPELQNMPLWEAEAHQAYADAQEVYEEDQ